MQRMKLKGVGVISFLLIASSVIHMNTLIFSRDWYWHNFSYLSPSLLLVRYLFSWAQRILGLVVAIGILRLKNSFRWLAIAMGCFTVLTLYWKHPYQAFLIHAQYLDQQLGFIFAQLGHPEISFAKLTVPALIMHCVLDIIFWGSSIYYLTRPSVKKHFS
ncbi:MAG: hypothetical protein ABIC68_08580 [Candidatus Omnitrophota bacterium]